MTQEKIIIKYLEAHYPNWIPGFRFHGLDTEWGFIGSRGERTLREMREDGIVERQLNEKGFAIYRVKKERGQANLF